jgi:sugar lactone lactonase YvrE
MQVFKALSTSRDRVGECPVWSAAEQALYWVDIEGKRIHRFDWQGKSQQTWMTDERVGCIALVGDADKDSKCVIAAMESGIFELELQANQQTSAKLLASIEHPIPNMRFNDGRCDSQGRFWVSTMCMDMKAAKQVGAVYCFDENGLGAHKAEGLITPNGMAFSPDDAIYYLSDSHPTVQKIWAFDFNSASGVIANGREFVDMTLHPGRPDGAAVDTDGNYWICANDAGKIHQFSPQGGLLSSLNVPVSKPSMCAFGGPDMNILFVTSIQPAIAVGNEAGLSGAVFSVELNAKGQVEPCFSRFPATLSSAFLGAFA